MGAATVVTLKLDDLANGLMFVQRELIWVKAAALMAKKPDVVEEQEKALQRIEDIFDVPSSNMSG